MLSAERLIQLRKSKKLTQRELAAVLGLERTTYVKYEKGGIQPPNDMIVKLSEFFDVTSDYLLGITADVLETNRVLPDKLKNIAVAFQRGEFEGLTPEEVEALAIVAKTLKSQRAGQKKHFD